MSLEKIRFRLTKSQEKLLKPLFDKAIQASNNQTPGSIVCQLQNEVASQAIFVDEKTTNQLLKIFKKYRKETKCKP